MTPKQPVRDQFTSDLFPELIDLETPDQVEKELLFKPMRHPVWSHQKARLIEKYLYYFVMVTKHGTYIDGFAGPQAPDKLETWSAKRVIESKPRFLRNFFLCELDAGKVEMLKTMWREQPPREKKEAKRTCSILQGDFNERVGDILSAGVIDEKQAAFALLDQRTFECHWATVEKLARHKPGGNKIELFYFLAVKWLHRSLSGIGRTGEAKVRSWWGKDDWRSLQEVSQEQIRDLVRARFTKELGYRYAFPFPIWEDEDGEGSVMYYMIHATDHDQAPGLMLRAYNNAIGPHVLPEQAAFAEF